MLIHKLKSAAIAACGLCLLGFGALVAAQQAAGTGRATATPPGTELAGAPDATTTLRLLGTTEYDPATVSTVRLPFGGRVDRVRVDLGSAVKKGDPLLEVFSADLAAAKGEYELASIQWEHDRKVLGYKKPLARSNTLPTEQLIDAEDAESRSRLKMRLARDRLLVHGLTEPEIEAARNEDGVQKGRMIVRARADGVVVQRDVVQGNLYDSKETLLTIAPLDHLWVRGGVAERDAEKIQVGQPVKIILPFSDRVITTSIAYIEKAIDPGTRLARFRATIPNPEGRIKAGAFVRVELETEGRPSTPEASPGPGRPSPSATTDRLDALERKVDRLLGESQERSSHARILDRLDALERKVDRLLEGRERRSP